MTGDNATFDRRVVIALVLVGFLSFGTAVYFSLYGSRVSVAPDSYSKSALGHYAFAEALRDTYLELIVSRHRSDEKTRPGDLLILAEPAIDRPWAKTLYTDVEPRVRRGAKLLLVLPKRTGQASADNDSWIGWQGLIPGSRIRAAMPPGLELPRIHRPGTTGPWVTNEFGIDPSLTNPQLLALDPSITPMIATADGILLGYKWMSSSGGAWILSDPDLIANHGIDDGENTRLVAAMMERIIGQTRRVVIDETIHGYRFTPNLWRQIFELPLLMVTLPAMLLMLLIAWMAGCRFGSPVPPPPPLEPGKAGLIANTAELMLFGGHGAEALRRYCQFTRQDVAERLHAPKHLGGAALDSWMAHVESHRNVTLPARSIAEEIDTACRGRGEALQMTRLAMKVHRWKKEMLNGA